MDLLCGGPFSVEHHSAKITVGSQPVAFPKGPKIMAFSVGLETTNEDGVHQVLI